MARRTPSRADLIAVACIAVALGYFACSTVRHRIPESVGEQAISRVADLQPGMTDETVFKTLGLDGYGLSAASSGSGPRTAWPTWYFVTHDRAIMIRWDLTKNPPLYVKADVAPTPR